MSTMCDVSTLHLAYRGIDFAGGDGPTVKSIVSRSAHSQNALDADHSTEVTGKDASFLNKVNLGIFVFVEEVDVSHQGCTTRLQAQLYAKDNGAIDASLVALFFDVAVEHAASEAAIRTMTAVRGGPVHNLGSVLVSAVCVRQQKQHSNVCR